MLSTPMLTSSCSARAQSKEVHGEGEISNPVVERVFKVVNESDNLLVAYSIPKRSNHGVTK